MPGTVVLQNVDGKQDQALIHHIPTNLLSNAMKYSPDQGSIWLDVIGLTFRSKTRALAFHCMLSSTYLKPYTVQTMSEKFKAPG